MISGGEACRTEGSVAAVILNWNRSDLTLRCVASIREQVDHVYVVDNDSKPEDRKQLYALEDGHTTILVRPRNGGYAAGCNTGVEAAVGAGFAAVLIMNNDAFADPSSVGLLVARLDAAPAVGAVGPVVVRHGTREVLHAACALDLRTGRPRWLGGGLALHELGDEAIATGYISGEVMLIRSSVIKQVAMFDERYFCYYEDVDWSVRARRASWRLEVVPQAVFEHIVGASSPSRVGTFYRSRNLPLFLRVALGRTRLAALVLAAPTELLLFGSLVRRGELALAFAGVIGGWLAGAAMRSEDARYPR